MKRCNGPAEHNPAFGAVRCQREFGHDGDHLARGVGWTWRWPRRGKSRKKAA